MINMLEKLFRSRAEVAVLDIVLFEDGLHLREIARRAGVSPFEAKRELDTLSALGILIPEKRGNQVAFHANGKCTFIGDLRNLFRKTESIIGKIRQNAAGLKGIRYCMVFGSASRGQISEKSDIDILVIGDVDEDELGRVVLNLQKESRREINYILWNESDFNRKLGARSSFLAGIHKRGFVWIGGDKDEFVRLVEEAYGREG